MGDMGGGSAAKSFPPPRQQVPCLFSLPGPKGVGAYDAYVQPSPLKQLYSLPPLKRPFPQPTAPGLALALAVPLMWIKL